MHAQAHAQAFSRRGEGVQFIILLWTCQKPNVVWHVQWWFMGFMDWVVFHCFFCIVTGIALGVFKRYQPPSSQGGPKIDKSSMMLDCFPGSLEPWAMMNHYYLSMYQASFNLDAPCIHKQQNQLHIRGRARWKAPVTIHLHRGGAWHEIV